MPQALTTLLGQNDAGAQVRVVATSSDPLGTSTAPRYDRIRDLVIGTDTITMATAFAAPAAAFSLGSGATSRSFLVLNDGVAGYQAATDGLIEITGFSGNLGGLAIL